MTFSNWDHYADLLDKIVEQRDTWADTRTLPEFDERIRTSHSDLVAGEAGFAALVAELRPEFLSDENEVYEQIKLVVLARPGLELGLGEEWTGYFISERIDGTQVYADDRHAVPSSWLKVEVSTKALSLDYDDEAGLMYDSENWYLRDGRTIVWADQDRSGVFVDGAGKTYVHGEPEVAAEADLREQHFDEETGRWRRLHEQDNEFEYYHDNDGVWERWHDEQWHRLHAGAGTWLAYHEDSETWLHDNEWQSYDAVTHPVPVVPDEEDDEDEPEQFVAAMASSFEEVVAAIRAEDISADELSDDEILTMFEQHIEQQLAVEIPEFRQLIDSD
jgi:hypothetical protein